jgi:transposase
LRFARAWKNSHRGPDKASTIDAVRGLVETTNLSYRAIAARTGVAIGTIARHVRRGGWLRPETGFPEEHYTPEGRRLRRR